jgi:hypothetical protein
MEFIFIILSWMILLVPGFDDSVPPTGDQTFKIEYSDLVQSINTRSDETLDFWGFDIVLKQNSSGILDIKIPRNFPTPASYANSWYHNDGKPLALADGFEISYEIVEDPCFLHYRMSVENKTNVEILYTVILTGTWQLYSPIQFDETDPCYSKVFLTSSVIPSYKPQIEIIPSTTVRYGDSFTIHAWLDSYEKPDDLRYAIDVFDENGRQVDSTLWFARQDFVYEFDTTHPAYNITKGGPYLIKIEQANGIERTGIIETTLHFEIVKSDIITPESNFVTFSSGLNYVPIIVLMIAGIGVGICFVVIFLILRKRK